MIHGSLRAGLLAAAVGLAGFSGCGPTTPPKCQASNCSGCCSGDGTCLGISKQSYNACGVGGASCRTCVPGQDCTNLRCVATATGGGNGGNGGSGGAGGGSGGGSGTGGGGGGAACGASGQACCVGGTGCLLGLFCVNSTCGTTPPSDGGTGGGSGTGGGGGAAGGGAGGGTALHVLGDPCVVNGDCLTNNCQAFGFPGGICTKACTTQADCPVASECSRNPAGGGNICLPDCTAPGTAPANCRTGYVCEKFQASINNLPVCFPGCASALSCVGGPVTCDGRGFCCGSAGAACCNNSACDTGFTCDAATHYCKTIAATGRATGEACTADTNCAGNLCILEIASSPPLCTVSCFTAGYCSAACTTLATGCPEGGICTAYTVAAGGKRCASTCTWDGGQGDCRANYVCDRYVVGLTGNTAPTCFKKCFADSECTPGAPSCQNGFCCGNAGYRCCPGATKCAGGGTCNALDYCL